jgi:AraC family transcriptional activator of pobA
MPSPRDIRLDDDAGRNGPIFVGRGGRFVPGRRPSSISHDFAALAFYRGGTARIEQGGVWDLQTGDVFIVPAGAPHRHIAGGQPGGQPGGLDVWTLGFCVSCVAVEASQALLEPFDRVRGGAAPVVRIPRDRRGFLDSLFIELSGPSAAPGADAPVRLSLLTLILNEVRRAADWAKDAGPEPGIVADSLRYIERHCLGPLTLAQVAAAMKRTPSYLTTALTRATGRSAVAWIIAGRMAEARRRLLHSAERIDIIAERVGYSDSTHFIRLFRRAHGSTPAAWRAQHVGPGRSG